MRKKGGRPVKYENGLEKIIKFCEAKTPERIPADFACAPLLDNADENDERVLKILRQMGHRGRQQGAERCPIDDPGGAPIGVPSRKN